MGSHDDESRHPDDMLFITFCGGQMGSVQVGTDSVRLRTYTGKRSLANAVSKTDPCCKYCAEAYWPLVTESRIADATRFGTRSQIPYDPIHDDMVYKVAYFYFYVE